MDINSIFEQCRELQDFDPACEALLKRLMEIKNPAKFDMQDITDADLDALVAEMRRIDDLIPEVSKVMQTLRQLAPSRVSTAVFI